MKTAMVEILLNSGLNFELPNHGGKIIRTVTLTSICKDLNNIYTGYLQPIGYDSGKIETLIVDTIRERDLDKLIDIWKELVQHDITAVSDWAKYIKSILSLTGLLADTPYLEYDGLYCKGNEDIYANPFDFEQAYKLIYSDLIRPDNSLQIRNAGVDRFISILLANPAGQKKALQTCLSCVVVAHHFNPLTPRARLLALRKYLLDVVNGTNMPESVSPKEETTQRYVDPLKNQPYLFFTGTRHLTAKPLAHGDLDVELATLSNIINDTTQPTGDRLDDCLAYLHRSNNQKSLAKSFTPSSAMHELEAIDDCRKRAVFVENRLKSILATKPTPSTDASSDKLNQLHNDIDFADVIAYFRRECKDGAKIHPSPFFKRLLEGKPSTFTQVLNKLLDPNNKDHNTSEADQLKANKSLTANTLIDNLFFNSCQNPKALPSLDGILNQIEYGRENPTSQGGSIPMNNFGWSQGSANEEAAPQKVLITGGDPVLRARLGAMFQKDGIPFEFTDGVPEVQSEAIIYKAEIGNVTWAMEAFPSSGQYTVTPHISSGKLESLHGKLQQDQSFDSVWNEIKKGAQSQHPFRYISSTLLLNFK